MGADRCAARITDRKLQGAVAIADQSDLGRDLAEKRHAPLVRLARGKLCARLDRGQGAPCRKLGVKVPDHILQVGVITCQIPRDDQCHFPRRVRRYSLVCGRLDRRAANSCSFPAGGLAQRDGARKPDGCQERNDFTRSDGGKVGFLGLDQLGRAAGLSMRTG